MDSAASNGSNGRFFSPNGFIKLDVFETVREEVIFPFAVTLTELGLKLQVAPVGKATGECNRTSKSVF